MLLKELRKGTKSIDSKLKESEEIESQFESITEKIDHIMKTVDKN